MLRLLADCSKQPKTNSNGRKRVTTTNRSFYPSEFARICNRFATPISRPQSEVEWRQVDALNCGRAWRRETTHHACTTPSHAARLTKRATCSLCGSRLAPV